MKKRGWVIYTKKSIRSNSKDNAFDWMVEEGHNEGLDVEVHFEEDLEVMITPEGSVLSCNNRVADLPDFVLLRTYNFHLSSFFESKGIRTINSTESLMDCQDKWKTHELLSSAGLPMPKTLLNFNKEISFDEVASKLGSPFIIKNNYGSRGEGVYLIHNDEELKDSLSQFQSGYIFQEFINTSYGKDVRVHVIGGEVIACVLRSSDKDFRSNFSQGGNATSYEITEEIKQLSIDAAKAMNLEIAGIDLLFGPEGIIICEINGIPGFRTVWLTSKTNIPSKIFKYVRESDC